MRKLLYISILVISVGNFAACSSGCSSSTSSPRAKEARECAVAAAKELIATDHSDTMALQHKLLEVKAVQSKYAIDGDSGAVNAFDEAFREYVSKNDAALANAIF